MRLKEVATVTDGVEEPRGKSRLDGNVAVSLVVQKQSGGNTVVWCRARAAGGFRRSCHSQCANAVSDRAVSIHDALRDVTLTMMGTIACGASSSCSCTVVATDPDAVVAGLADRRRLAAGPSPTRSTTSRSSAWPGVGLVVDDASCSEHHAPRRAGEPPFQAALRSSREVDFTIISISARWMRCSSRSSSCRA